MKTYHCIVKGIVQGVFYRASTQEKAQSLVLTGWVRNLSNGDVELKATGEPEILDQLVKWLWQGPTHAKVEEVIVNEIALEPFNDFSIK